MRDISKLIDEGGKHLTDSQYAAYCRYIKGLKSYSHKQSIPGCSTWHPGANHKSRRTEMKKTSIKVTERLAELEEAISEVTGIPKTILIKGQ